MVISFGHINYSADSSGRSPAEIAGSNPAGAWMFVESVVCCQVKVSATN